MENINKQGLRTKIIVETKNLNKYDSHTITIMKRTACGGLIALGLMASALGTRLYNNHEALNIPILAEVLESEKVGDKQRAKRIRESPEFRSYIPWAKSEQRKEDYLKYAAIGVASLSVLGMGIGAINPRQNKIRRELERDLQSYELQ